MRERVLVVDDEPGVLHVCRRAFRRLGYDPETASSTEEALELLSREQFDLLVTDIMMPGITGLELLARALELQPHLAAIVITGFGTIELAIKALRAGARDFVVKPFSVPDLRDAAEHALTQARLARESGRLRALLPLLNLTRQTLRDVDRAALLSRIVDIAVAESRSHGGGLVAMDGESERWRLWAVRGGLPDPLPDLGSLAELARATEQVQVLELGGDLPLELEKGMQQAGLGTTLLVPLRAPSRFVGVLILTNKGNHASFPEADLGMLSILGSQAAALLENARLVAELETWNRELEARVAERTQELEAAQAELLRAERLATIGALGAGVAHELRNPLGVISNSAYYLNSRLKDAPPKIVKHLGIIDREVAASNRIITGLMNFVRVRELKTTPSQPRRLVEETLQRASLPEDVSLHTQFASDLPLVEVDADKMQEVFLNLIDNSTQAMPRGGDLTIGAVVQDGCVEISFDDTGEGIPPSNLEQVFKPLFTTKVKGIGLGLALVRLLVEAHRGTVTVTSQVGVGSRFVVRLPCNVNATEERSPL
ncbi:MAG TPA: response regulator [Anaerolineae bacterium]|nr:response regulator [Anaerolineae bacterium]